MHFTARMPPNHQFMLNNLPMEPVSRTYQYRKIMKPMLERKRRARINKCLDELKDLMTGTLQADGENVSKLEKADILELTVRHLQTLREKNALFVRHSETVNMDKFWAGFQHCATEVAQFLNKYDQHISGDLVQFIRNYIPNIVPSPSSAAMPTQKSVAAVAATTGIPLVSKLATLQANVPNRHPPMSRELTANYQRLYNRRQSMGVVSLPASSASSSASLSSPSTSPAAQCNNASLNYNIKREREENHFHSQQQQQQQQEQQQQQPHQSFENLAKHMKKEIIEEPSNVWRPW